MSPAVAARLPARNVLLNGGELWPRRTGAGRVLSRLGINGSEIRIPRRERSCEWLHVAILECARCHQVVERVSPMQRHCRECRRVIKRLASLNAMRRSRVAATLPAAENMTEHV